MPNFCKQNWQKIHWKLLKKSEFSPSKLKIYWYDQIPPNWGSRWSYSYLEATFCFTEKFHMGVINPIFQPGFANFCMVLNSRAFCAGGTNFTVDQFTVANFFYSWSQTFFTVANFFYSWYWQTYCHPVHQTCPLFLTLYAQITPSRHILQIQLHL